MLAVHGVVGDRGIEPEPVAVGLAVIEAGLDLLAPPTAAAPAAPPPFLRALLRLRLLRVLIGLLGILSLGFHLGLLGRGGLDLGLDLVAEVDFAGGGVLLVGG